MKQAILPLPIAKTLVLTGFVASTLFAANSAQAAIITYTNQTSFLNAIQSGYYLEGFESLSLTGLTASPINYSNGTYSYQASAQNGFVGAGTSGDHWLATNTAANPVTISNLTPTITAIGGFFFTSDLNGSLISGTINVSVNGGSSSLSTSTNSSTNFFGFISDNGTPLTGLVVNATQTSGSRWATTNNLIVGQAATTAVPEPLTILGAMTAAGFGAGFKRKLAKSKKDEKDA
jgi:hypothetical protein